MHAEHAIVGVFVALLALACSLAMIPVARWVARVLGAFDHPGQRKIHKQTTPRTGGVAVFVAFVGVVVGGYASLPSLLQANWLQSHFAGPAGILAMASRVAGPLFALLIGAGVVFVTGLLDDVLERRFPVWLKVAGQIAAALIVMASGIGTVFLPWSWLDHVVTLLWLVGICNAFNLLDNMDGLSAGVAFVASGILLANAWVLGEFFIALILLAFMGALLGFLVFNFHPASIFLGDCGSLLIGFVLATITLLETYITPASSSRVPILMPVLVLALPVMDTFTVMTIRLREGRPVYVGDARHLSHRLLAIGFSQRQAALFLYLTTMCLGLGALLLPKAGPRQTALVVAQAVCTVILLLVLMFVTRPGSRSGRENP